MPDAPIVSPDIAFLIKCGIDGQKLGRLALQAASLGVDPHQHLLATGVIDEPTYYRAFAATCGLPFAEGDGLQITARISSEEAGHAARAGIARASLNGLDVYVLAPEGAALMAFLQRFGTRGESPHNLIVVTPSCLRRLLLEQAQSALLDHSVDMLQRVDPSASARRSFISFIVVCVGLAIALVAAVDLRAPVFAPLFGFFCAALYLQASALRVLALADVVDAPLATPPALNERDLPVCSVLVPLYKEGRIVAQLVAALRTLDYPHAKLDILILIEATDDVTRHALSSLALPPFMRVITVPDGMPRTKPRALQVGLSFARGEMVTIFDAEDLPHPQQVRHAAAMLKAGGAKLACVQAQLKIDNAGASWLSRQFALEYAALFTVFLPALTKRDFPVLLGGTSNYFKTDILRDIGGWDPWNVTEDADLGLRIARHGYHVATISTPTEEEAPTTFRNWFMQRMRWQKGWMQTLVVHFSRPRVLLQGLGLVKTCVVVATLCTSLMSALAYPLMLAWIAYGVFLDPRLLVPDALGAGVFGLSMAAFIGGHVFAYLHVFAGARRAGQKVTMLSLLTIWAYWLLVSFAAYGALIGLARSPFHWNKTEHFGRNGEASRRRLAQLLSRRSRTGVTVDVNATSRLPVLARSSKNS